MCPTLDRDCLSFSKSVCPASSSWELYCALEWQYIQKGQAVVYLKCLQAKAVSQLAISSLAQYYRAQKHSSEPYTDLSEAKYRAILSWTEQCRAFRHCYYVPSGSLFSQYWLHLCNCPFHHRSAGQWCSVYNFIVVTWIWQVVFLHLLPDGITAREKFLETAWVHCQHKGVQYLFFRSWHDHFLAVLLTGIWDALISSRCCFGNYSLWVAKGI